MLVVNTHPFPELQTNRTVLRKVRATDAPELFFMRSDERVMKYIDKERCKDENEALAFIQKILKQEENNEALTWAITLRGNDTLVGTICLWNMFKEHYRCELGYALHPGLHRKGIMQEVIEAVLEYGFATMKFHTIQANINPENEASAKILEKNKFVREAYFKENFYFNGKFLDSAIYSRISPYPVTQ